MSKILVVGGAGYIGTVLTEALLERGYAVKVLDRLYFGEDSLRGVLDRIELVRADMRLVGPALFEDVDAVINVGGLSNDATAEYNPQANYEMNTVSTRTLAAFCKENGVRRYIFASSCSLYDRGVDAREADVVQDESSEVHPQSAYPHSKYDAERALLEMADERFCPVILRIGTSYGFSPRMRYDLVVNTFVKDALSKDVLTLHCGGEMWRPLIDVRDVARAYIACLEAEEEQVCGEIFNLVFENMRISELALRVREAFRQTGVQVDIRPQYEDKKVRSYRVSGHKIERVLGFSPSVTIAESVLDIIEKIKAYRFMDFGHPRYYNIAWMRFLDEWYKENRVTGSVFEAGEVLAPLPTHPLDDRG